MLFAMIRKPLRSILFRLTCWHAAMLFAALALCYIVSYALVNSSAISRLDTYLSTEASKCNLLLQLKGRSAVVDEMNREALGEGIQALLFRLYDAQGQIIAQTQDTAWQGLTLSVGPAAGVERTYFSTTRHGKEPLVRALLVPLRDGSSLLIASSMSDLLLIQESMMHVRVLMAAVWLVTTLVGFVLIKRHVNAISRVRDAAVKIAAGHIILHPPESRWGDEVDELARTFNVMAERISCLLENLRQTNDNLAHELRSPLTRMRGRCELGLTENTTPEEYRSITCETIEECDQLLGFINTILELSEATAGTSKLRLQAVDLKVLLAQACDLYIPVAEDVGVTLSLQATDGTFISGDIPKLQRLFSNLLDNAVKYTRPPGTITVSVRREAERARVRIKDTGCGIPPQELGLVFNRFYRGQNGKELPGYGLGLHFAQTIARLHDGDISVVSAVGLGTEFVVDFPLAPGAASNITRR